VACRGRLAPHSSDMMLAFPCVQRAQEAQAKMARQLTAVQKERKNLQLDIEALKVRNHLWDTGTVVAGYCASFSVS
jgi:hypothetical protein